MTPCAGAREIGMAGEREAERFYEEQGFEIVARNFRCGRVGEIDLIVRKGDFFVFAEIKTRRGEAFGGGLYSLSAKKKNSMRRTAGFFIDSVLPASSKGLLFRFDLVCVESDGIQLVADILR